MGFVGRLCACCSLPKSVPRMTTTKVPVSSPRMRFTRGLLAQGFIFLFVCNQAIAQVRLVSAPPDIRVDGDVIYYAGLLNSEGTKAVTTLITSGQYKTLHIRSPGGDILSAMDFGVLIYDHELNVVINKQCGSSCANYIFPAGKHKKIEPGSLVMWHGDARQRNFLDELKKLESKAENDGLQHMTSAEQSRLKHRRHSIAAQDAFYKKIGIDGSIARIGQEIDFPVKQWLMPVKNMAEFGITNIDAPQGYGTKEYCQRWVAARDLGSKVSCLDLPSHEIESWRSRSVP
jgi:hypothetical protein